MFVVYIQCGAAMNQQTHNRVTTYLKLLTEKRAEHLPVERTDATAPFTLRIINQTGKKLLHTHRSSYSDLHCLSVFNHIDFFINMTFVSIRLYDVHDVPTFLQVSTKVQAAQMKKAGRLMV